MGRVVLSVQGASGAMHEGGGIREAETDVLYSPVAVDVDFHTGIDAFLVLMAADSGVAVFFSHADIDILALTAAGAVAVAVFLSDADVLAVAVVSTGRALGGISLTSIFPSSAFNSDSLVSLDFSGFGNLLVPVS